jgi:hypothetical protein
MIRRSLVLGCIALAWATSAPAQSINVDIGSNVTYPLPSSAYGAGAAQPGVWNAFSAVGPTSLPMVDIAGASTSVTLTVTGLYFADFESNNAGTTGDDQKLMDDIQDLGGAGSAVTWTFSNLSAGNYTLYTYAWAPDNAAFQTSTSAAGSSDPAQTCGGAWPVAGQTLGTTYARHHFTVAAGGSVAATVTVVAGFGSVNGLQLQKEVATPATAFCFGDGTGTACPCGNAGAAGKGCANSIDPSGARLASSGVASIAADTFTLLGTDMPNSSALYFQGTAQAAGGAGSLFGDGLRCAAGSVLRLGTKTNVAGVSQYPAGADTPISVKGLNSAGVLRHYQCWYRNADSVFCTPSTFNLTNGLSVTWVL